MNMFQKVMMCALVLGVSIPSSAAGSSVKNVVIVAGATAAVVGTAAYLSYRESNSVKIARAKCMMNEYRGEVEQSLSLFSEGIDMNLATNGSATLKADMVNMQNQLLMMSDELESRYESWVAPWNWTKDMQDACNQVQQFRLQIRLVLLLLAVQQAHELIANFSVRIDQALMDLNTAKSFYGVLKNSRSLKKDLQSSSSMVRCLQQDLAARAFLKESSAGISYEAMVAKTERALGDFIQKMDLLLIVLSYAPCFVPDIDELNLVKAVRVICGKDSSYPVMYIVDKLGSDIERINNMTIYVPCEQICLDMLDNVRTRLMESEQQAIERQAYENYLQQQRLAAAAEAQACAARAQAVAAQCQANAMQQQARAQQRQAAALEESNKIERQKNKQ